MAGTARGRRSPPDLPEGLPNYSWELSRGPVHRLLQWCREQFESLPSAHAVTHHLTGRDALDEFNASYLLVAADPLLPTARTIAVDDVTLQRTDAGAGGAYTLSVKANGISNTHLRDSIATSVIGRSANSAGDPADIQAGTVGHVLRLGPGPVLGFGLAPPSTVENHYLGSKALTNAAHVGIFDVAITTGQTCGGVVKTFIHVDDATDFEVEVAEHTYAGSNKAGTEAFTGPTTAIITQHFTGAGAMAVVYSMLVGADKITFRVLATSGLGAPTTLTCRWELVELAGRAVTVL